jgi:hypothetical protein
VADRLALDRAIERFLEDADIRADALETRRNLKKAIVAANVAGWSDQQLANAFKRANEQLALSRARIQQLRTGD